jgi:hypothetical protein
MDNGVVYTQGRETGTGDRQRSDYVAAPLSLNGLPAGSTERSLSPTHDTHVALGSGTPGQGAALPFFKKMKWLLWQWTRPLHSLCGYFIIAILAISDNKR